MCCHQFTDEETEGGYWWKALEGIGVCMDTSKIEQNRISLRREDVFREISNLHENDKAMSDGRGAFLPAN